MSLAARRTALALMRFIPLCSSKFKPAAFAAIIKPTNYSGLHYCAIFVGGTMREAGDRP